MRYTKFLKLTKIIVIYLTISFWSVIFLNAEAQDLKKINLISDKYIFSTADSSFQGEGFFVEFSNGDKIFVFNSDFARNPHDIENLRRKIEAVQRGKGNLSYEGLTKREVFIVSKTTLGEEHKLLTEEDRIRQNGKVIKGYRTLAEETVRVGQKTALDMVLMDQIDIKQGSIKIDSSDINSIGPMAMTSGGSVYVFSVNLKNDQPLNIGVATVDEGGLQRLEEFSNQLRNKLKEGEIFSLIADNLSFQDAIFVVKIDSNGNAISDVERRSGWVANINYVSLE